ncbi:MAG: tetratricopeptide repeat protein [Hydrogenovibrio sp.]|uniref:tetratricopeptide repeat protein n=1 Tax=Hydrogenovibrio sp. TaxID=2065821 RepID=UPI0028705824|nr:tetratricopeptide repeat protein [Hydrogenovibrio sp.]MDR9499652.1 tetratricopeptide repeat protein [Hydrogenovibrio sp.]
MKTRYKRSIVAISTLFLFGLFGWAIVNMSSEDTPQMKPDRSSAQAEKEFEADWVDPKGDPGNHARQAKQQEVKWRFNQAVAMLHAKQYEYAVKALHRVLELAPRMPEAHVNMGFAFLGGGDVKSARDFFTTALEINPDQLNAYYGLAMAAEAQNDMEVALGAMRTYVHLSQPDDPYLRRARAALWEWQAARDKETKMYERSESEGESGKPED